MSKITSLTKEQWAAVYAARQEWRQVGLCTEPADRCAAEAVVSGFYRRLGKERPMFIWLNGPASCCLIGPQIMAMRGIVPQLYAQLRTQLRTQLGDQLYAQLGDQLDAQLYAQLGDQKQLELAKKVWSLREWGAEYCWWIAWYVVARDVCGVRYRPEQSELLDQWATLVRSTGWWFPAENVCFMTERHRALYFDENKRLHAENGPAIECRDGYKVYAWHGTRIPAEWIENKSDLKPETALTWQNIEQRRAACEILGWRKILDSLPHRVINEDPEPEIGTLLEVDLPDSPKERFLRVRCGTGRDFVLPVPQECQTALDAQAWMYPGIDAEAIRGRDART